MTILLTMPQATYAPGTFGPFVTSALDASVTGYVVNYTLDGTTYPTSGGDVLAYQVERSDDNGGTWNFHAAVILGAKPASDTRTQIVGFAKVGPGLNATSNTLLRGTMIVYQTCTIGGTLETQP